MNNYYFMKQLIRFMCAGAMMASSVTGVFADDSLKDLQDKSKVLIDEIMYEVISVADKTVMTTYPIGPDINGNEQTIRLEGAVTIPGSVVYKDVTYTVTQIGQYSFMSAYLGPQGLTSITLPNTIEIIGNQAFQSNVNLTEFNVPTSCKSLGAQAFAYTGLNRITIPEGVEIIGNQCFVETDIAALVIPNSVNLMGEACFSNMNSLKYIKLGSGVTKLPTYCMHECIALETVELGENIDSIYGMALAGLDKLTTLNLPAKVRWFGDRAMVNQLAMQNYTVDPYNPYYTAIDGVIYSKDKTEIVKYPTGRTAASYTIPEGVKAIADCCFDHTSFTSFTLPTSMERIGKYAFWYNDKMTTFDYNNCNLQQVDEGAFTMCSMLERVKLPDTPVKLGDLVWYWNEKLSQIDLGGAVSLGDLEFNRCDALESFNLPASVTYVGASLFLECPNFKTLTVSSDSKDFSAEDNILFNKDKSMLMMMPDPLKIENYTVPPTVKQIYFGAFQNCENLKVLNFGENTDSIEANAITGCINLEEITLGPATRAIAEGFTDSRNRNIMKIYVKATVPPTFPMGNRFSRTITQNATLYVPESALHTYKAATVWNEFVNIEGVDFSSGVSITTFGENEPEIVVKDGIIIVNGADGLTVNVYSLQGVSVYSGSANDIIVSSQGIYLVKVGSKTAKVAL